MREHEETTAQHCFREISWLEAKTVDKRSTSSHDAAQWFLASTHFSVHVRVPVCGPSAAQTQSIHLHEKNLEVFMLRPFYPESIWMKRIKTVSYIIRTLLSSMMWHICFGLGVIISTPAFESTFSSWSFSITEARLSLIRCCWAREGQWQPVIFSLVPCVQRFLQIVQIFWWYHILWSDIEFSLLTLMNITL